GRSGAGGGPPSATTPARPRSPVRPSLAASRAGGPPRPERAGGPRTLRSGDQASRRAVGGGSGVGSSPRRSGPPPHGGSGPGAARRVPAAGIGDRGQRAGPRRRRAGVARAVEGGSGVADREWRTSHVIGRAT